MKKYALLPLLMIVFLCDASIAATRRPGATSPQSPSSDTTATTARAATVRGARGTTAQQPATTNRVTARAATTTTTAPKQPAVTARAGTTQKIINTGTKVASATKNTVVSEECANKYNGCMDAFCMLDNATGARCTCSNRNTDLLSILSEIERLDEQTYQMATLGIEQLEMGADADAAIASANNVTQSIRERGNTNQQRRLDFSSFDAASTATTNLFQSSEESDSIDNKTGDALFKAADSLCKSQIPECESELSTLQLLYSQQVKSDCLAFENTLKKKRSESSDKLLSAERALREVALEQHQSANKYDLGQCTIEFKKCMQTTAGCGKDFVSCAGMVNSAATRSGSTPQKYVITGAVSEIQINATTYDLLIAKKPMCESVTKQCTAVADKVWNAFLTEAAVEIKSAELIAQDNAQQNCISEISACFQKACKDNIDPSDPDGSYDMCLSRPGTMLQVCSVPLTACGINTTSQTQAEKSEIWQFVAARLSAMRSDECTKQIKQCLQSSDRCGSDYSQCIGLDKNVIINDMCPLEKLTACNSSNYGNNPDQIKDYVLSVANGLLLNIDNNLMTTCQNAVKSKMLELCGNTVNCLMMDTDSNLGRGSLQTHQTDTGDYVIDGVIRWNNIKITSHPTPDAEYTIETSQRTGDTKIRNRINSVIEGIEREYNTKMSLFTQDPVINMCLTGRNMQQITGSSSKTAARFPNLLKTYEQIMLDSVLALAQTNYERDYAAELSRANTQSQEYKNRLYCNAMTDFSNSKAAKVDTSMANTKYGIIDETDYSITLSGATTEDNLAAMNTNNKREFEIRDDNGSMIAKTEIYSTYEPGPQTCRLTSYLYACTGYEAIYEGQSKSVNVDTSVSYAGIGAGVGVGTSTSSTTHKANFCSSYAEPLISEQVISFKSGDAIFGEVSRSNLQSTYTNSSNITNVNDSSWSVDLSASVATNQNVNDSTVIGDINQQSFSDNSTNKTINRNKITNIGEQKTNKVTPAKSAKGKNNGQPVDGASNATNTQTGTGGPANASTQGSSATGQGGGTNAVTGSNANSLPLGYQFYDQNAGSNLKVGGAGVSTNYAASHPEGTEATKQKQAAVKQMIMNNSRNSIVEPE